MNKFITDKYLGQNILIFNHLETFDEIRIRFPVVIFQTAEDLKVN